MEIIHLKTRFRKSKGENTLDELIYVIQVDQIHLDGIPITSKGPEVDYPCITLCYDDKDVKQAVRIVKEAEKQGREPEVYMHDRGDDADLIVMFRVQPISRRFLRGLMPKADRIRYEQKFTDQTTLVLVAGGRVSKDASKQFWSLYAKTTWFALNVALRLDSERKPLWGIRLETLTKGLPKGFGQ